jgi:hypothetical protein
MRCRHRWNQHPVSRQGRSWGAQIDDSLHQHDDAEHPHEARRGQRQAPQEPIGEVDPFGRVMHAPSGHDADGHHGDRQAQAERGDRRGTERDLAELKTDEQHRNRAGAGDQATGDAEQRDLARGDIAAVGRELARDVLGVLALVGVLVMMGMVAMDLGYENPAAFTIMFKRAFGSPPLAYLGLRNNRVPTGPA